MVRRWMGWTLLIVALMAGLSGWAASTKVVSVSSESGPTLWLPAGVEQEDQVGAVEEVTRFRRTWRLLFGHEPDLPDPLEVPAGGTLEETLFGTLWQQAAPSVAPADQAAVIGALRWIVLEDPSGVMGPLAKTAASGRWDASLASGVPLYVFLMEEVTEPAFLREALPPGLGAERLRAALSKRGISWERFWNRYASWLLAHAVEWGLMTPASGTLPAVWMLDAPMAPGEMSGWTFPLADLSVGLDLEFSGEPSPGLRLFHVSTDDLGRVTGSGLCELNPGAMTLPKTGKWVWIFLWNTSGLETGAGTALTLWSSYEAPFQVTESVVRAGVLDLHLREEAGIADYCLWAPTEDSKESSPVATFPSDGEGEHIYRLPIPLKTGSGFRLSCRTLAGGAYAAELPAEEPAP